MKNDIYWIYGGSAAGKETFIRKMGDGRPEDFIRRMGWNERKIIVIWESINYIAQYEGDPKGDKRIEIIDKVKKIPEDNSVILIKGQDIDINNKIPQLLKKELPSNNHNIIFLHTNIESMFKRCKNKKWWDETTTLRDFKGWIRYELRLLSMLKGFKIISLDSGESKNYKELKFPPKFE